MIAVILAGGKGTRLGELTKEIPKPMIRVGGKPVLEHQIELLKRYGITEIILLTNHFSDVIEEYFGDGEALGVNIKYFKEKEGEPLGTAGSVKALEGVLKDDFLVLYGDVMMDVNVDNFIRYHRAKNSKGTLALHPNSHPYDSDLVEVALDKRIVAFHSKPHGESEHNHNLVNACLYLLSPKIFSFIPKNTKCDFGKDIFPVAFKKIQMFGYLTAEYILDMGTPERLIMVEKDLASGKISALNNTNKRKAIFIDRDGTINKDVDLLHQVEDFSLLPGVIEAIKAINNSDYLAIVVTNQPVIARNLCTQEKLDEIHKKMETLLGREGAKIDSIYYCPHHPDGGYPGENPLFKTSCECRKPGIGMITEAARDYNIDIENSYIIGDSWRDVVCGENADLTPILVKKNQIGFDKKATCKLSFNDLLSAVSNLLGEQA